MGVEEAEEATFKASPAGKCLHYDQTGVEPVTHEPLKYKEPF